MTRIQLRRGTSSAWGTANPVLADGEPGWDKTSGELRVGDGATSWASLPVITGAGSSAEEHQFNAADYGLDVDGSTDNTEALHDARDAAVAWALANDTRYAEILLPVRADPYILGQSLIQGGTFKGNSQFPLAPINAGTARKLTLVYRAAVDAAAMPYWLQTVGQRWGVTLMSTLTGQTNSGTWGAPSVIGGPAIVGSSSEFGPSNSSNFNNVCVVLDGIGVSVPLNPTVAGIDLRGIAQTSVRRCAVVPNASTAQIRDVDAVNDWTFGIASPATTNNDRTVLDDVTVYGTYIGMIVGEHAAVPRSACIYCHDGIVLPADLDGTHSSWFGAPSVEGCVDAIRVYGTGRAPVQMDALSIETATGYAVNDPNNALRGHINLNQISGTIAVNGATNVRILSQNAALGAQTAPSVPASTVALRNPFWADCDVLVTGGTVTQVTIDGSTTGLTSGWFPLRPGGTIALTYSVAPTWKWWAR